MLNEKEKQIYSKEIKAALKLYLSGAASFFEIEKAYIAQYGDKVAKKICSYAVKQLKDNYPEVEPLSESIARLNFLYSKFFEEGDKQNALECQKEINTLLLKCPPYLSELNNKQESFCLEYIKDHNATQAAIRAGYSKKSARNIASVMLSKPNIKNRITELQFKAIQKTDITVDRILDEIKSIAFVNTLDIAKDETKNIKTNDKLRALELLGKFKQMFVDRIEERKTVEERKIIKLSGSMPDDE